MEIITEISENKYKLSLGSTNENLLDSALDTTHEIEEFDIWLDIKSDNEIERLNLLFEKLGGSVKKLTWCNWNQHELQATQVIELLNKLKSVEFLMFSSWCKPFSGSVEALDLPNLKEIVVSECKNFIIDFLASALPENVIESLKIDRVYEIDENLANLIKKQTSIVKLDIEIDVYTVESIKALKLEQLRIIMREKEGETEDQTKFLQTVIKSQPNLIHLDVLNNSDYSHSFVNDETFADIASLSSLESLVISVDNMTANGIKPISNLSALKNLQLKTNREKSLPLFKEFSEIENNSLETLVLILWSFEIPTETYTSIGKNFKSLKSLKITLGTRHPISFFAGAFPNLETLSIKFGESNNTVEFDQVFNGSSKIEKSCLKNLRLQFWGGEVVDTELFLKFLGAFDNLRKLDIHTKFPFKADFINQLAGKLNTIKSIKLSLFEIRNEETFPLETVEALKALREKVDFVSVSLRNVQHVNFGVALPDNVDGEFHEFTFQPLIDALEGIYRTKTSSMANIRIMNDLQLIAGNEE